MVNEPNRRSARVISPNQLDNSNYDARDQIEFRYAPTTWSDTESLDRSMSAMRLNGVRFQTLSITHY